MKAHIVLGHPEPKSFNAQLADISQQVLQGLGWETTYSDLYAMDFDAREGAQHYSARKDPDVFHTQTEQRFNADSNSLPAEIETEIKNLKECDLVIIHFPLWWFGMPAILKGWMDRVFVYGEMYRSAMRFDAGICAGKKAIACVTTGAKEESCSYNGKEADTQLLLWPILYPFRYLGFDVYEPEVLHGVGGVSFIEGLDGGLSTIETYKERWRDAVGSLSSRPMIPYNRDEEFDDTKRLLPDAPVFSPFVRQNPDSI